MFKYASKHVLGKKKQRRRRRRSEESAADPLRVMEDNDMDVDANVVSVALAPLMAEAPVATGDPIHCEGCHAVLTASSNVTFVAADDDEDDENECVLWQCEFCGLETRLEMDEMEFEALTTDGDTVQFILEPAPLTDDGGVAAPSAVMVMDTSGSMCVSYEVDGSFQLKGQQERDAKLAELNTDGAPQQLRARRGMVLGRRAQQPTTSYVTRLQLVQAAVDAQLTQLREHHGATHVGLVSFANDVCIHGDGVAEPVTIAGDALGDWDAVVERGTAAASTHLTTPVSAAYQAVHDRLYSLEEEGQTALGPALLAAIAMLGDNARGSKVIVCTDGLSNLGVGSLDTETPEEAEAAAHFYTRLSEYARARGIAVDVITMEGVEAGIEALGQVADVTGGEVLRVNPLAIARDFASAMANAPIATNLTVQVLLHHAMSFRREAPELLTYGHAGAQRTTRDLGTVTSATEVTFEYDLTVEDPEGGEGAAESPALPETVPFQMQVTYEKLNGARVLRVVNQTRTVTTEAAEAVEDLNVEVLGLNVAQRSAQMAQMGRYDMAETFAQKNALYMDANRAQVMPEQQQLLDNYQQTVIESTSMLQEQQQQIGSSATAAQLSATRNDELAATMYNFKSKNSSVAKEKCLIM